MNLHHIGIVIKDIEEGIEIYKKLYNFRQLTDIIIDEVQKVKLVFFSSNRDNVQIELITPTGPDSPVYNFLLKGGGLYHLCYETKNLDSDIAKFKKYGAKLIKNPVIAKAFQKRIAFLFFKREIIELVEM